MRILRHRLIFVMLIATSIAFARAQMAGTPVPKSPLQIYNEYLATYADLVPEYRTELTLGVEAGNNPKSPFRLARNALIGSYTYRPKTYTELTTQEQMDVERDEKFQAYKERKLKERQITSGIAESTATVQAKPLKPNSEPPAKPTGKETINITIDPDMALNGEPLIFEEPKGDSHP